MNKPPSIIYMDKNKLYDWVNIIFERIQRDEDVLYTDYFLWTITISYTDGTGFIYDIEECYAYKNFFINYHNHKTLEDIAFMGINSDWGSDEEKWYFSNNFRPLINEDVKDSRHEILTQIRKKYIKENNYLNYMNKGTDIYDTYFI